MFDTILYIFIYIQYTFTLSITLLLPSQYGWKNIICRGEHILRWYWCGLERCIACRLCDLICPSCALYILVACTLSNLRYSQVFTISYRRCIYCGYCMHVCPTDAITHSYYYYVFITAVIWLFFSKYFLFFFSLFYVDLYLQWF